MKRSIKKVVAAASLTVFATGCGSNPASISASSGSDRLTWGSGSGVTFESVHGMSDASAQALYINLNLTQTAQLASPVVNGGTLQANAIEVVGNKAYVAYNTQGVGYGGGIDVIDILSMSNPVMTSSATFADRDIAGLKRDTFDLYAAGSSNANGAELLHFGLGLLGDLSSTTPEVSPVIDSGGNSLGAVATGVGFWNGNIFLTTGEYGGLAVFQRNSLLDAITGLLIPGQVPAFYPLKDARGVSVNATGDVHVVTGYSTTGTGGTTPVRDYQYVFSNGGTPASVQAFSTDSWTTTDDEAKSSIVTGVTLDIITAGEAGIKLICKASGNTIQQVANPAVSGISNPALTAANAVTFGAGLVYVSNGAGGISVYSLEQGSGYLFNTCDVSLAYQGRIVFEDGASVNNVYYTLGKLIVATGMKGFRLVNVVALNALGLVSSL